MHTQSMLPNQNTLRDLPLWVPLLAIPLWILPDVTALTNMQLYRSLMNSEQGYIEIATAVFLLAFIILNVMALTKTWHSPIKGLRWWLMLLLLGGIYFLGEEISWGQQLFQWATPSDWAAINVQQETNLHNLGHRHEALTLISPKLLFNLLPKYLLDGAIILGGIVLVALQRLRLLKPFATDNLRYWIFPTAICFVPAILTEITTAIETFLKNVFGIYYPDIVSHSEIKEYMFAMFLLIYIVSLCRRSVQFEKAPAHVKSDDFGRSFSTAS